MKLKAVVLAVAMALIGNTAMADPSKAKAASSEVVTIVRSMLPVDAMLTKEVHTRFWERLDGMSKEGRNGFLVAVNDMMNHDMARQRAMWLSMRDTLNSKKATVNSEYEAVNERMRKGMEAQGMSTSRLDDEIKAFKAQLDALAQGRAIKQGDREVVVDLAMVKTVLDGMSGSYERVGRLLNRTWRQ